MLVRYLDIEGPLLIKPRVVHDERGHFFESWNQNTIDTIFDFESELCFVQENQSLSKRNVVRGLHYQMNPYAQGKLVRCISGSIFDVAVDLRVGFPSYGDWIGIHLSSENRAQFWIPPGFAHGFLCTSKRAEVLYKTTDYWDKDSERIIRWDDPDLGIRWPVSWVSRPILSAKDRHAPSFKEAEANGDVFV